MRNGHFLAKYLRWQISEVKDGTVLLPAAGETLAETLAGLTERDVLIIFAIRRVVPAIRAVLDLAPTLRCRTLVFADRYYSEPNGIRGSSPAQHARPPRSTTMSALPMRSYLRARTNPAIASITPSARGLSGSW